MTAKTEQGCNIPVELAITMYANVPAEMQAMFRNTFGEDFYKPKKEIWEEVVSVVTLNKYLKCDVRPISNPQDSRERAINAFAVLTQVAKLYNKDSKVEWKKGSIKFLPYLNLNEEEPCVRVSSARNYMYNSHFVYFVSGKLAQIAYDNFKEEFQALWDYTLEDGTNS